MIDSSSPLDQGAGEEISFQSSVHVHVHVHPSLTFVIRLDTLDTLCWTRLLLHSIRLLTLLFSALLFSSLLCSGHRSHSLLCSYHGQLLLQCSSIRLDSTLSLSLSLPVSMHLPLLLLLSPILADPISIHSA